MRKNNDNKQELKSGSYSINGEIQGLYNLQTSVGSFCLIEKILSEYGFSIHSFNNTNPPTHEYMNTPLTFNPLN